MLFLFVEKNIGMLTILCAEASLSALSAFLKDTEHSSWLLSIDFLTFLLHIDCLFLGNRGCSAKNVNGAFESTELNVLVMSPTHRQFEKTRSQLRCVPRPSYLTAERNVKCWGSHYSSRAWTYFEQICDLPCNISSFK